MSYNALSLRVILVLPVLGLVAGCAKAPPAVPIGDGLTVVAPDIAFERSLKAGKLPADWVVVGNVPKGALSIAVVNGTAALQVDGSAEPFAVMRRTKASLLATPYLTWGWNVVPTRKGPHPVQVVVGLRDKSQPKRRSWLDLGDKDASVDRLITIVWEETALGRGTVIGPIQRNDEAERARYIARGGQEQGQRWWIDTVDLSLIHHQIWPKDKPANMDIVLIGVAVAKADRNGVMNLAHVRLNR